MTVTDIKLTDEQQAIVSHDHGAALVFAVAGAGKTTAMIRRIERLVRERVFPAKHILATSFGKATVLELKRELKRSPQCAEVNAQTLHGVGHRVIQRAVKKGFRPTDSNPEGEMERLPNIITRRAVQAARREEVTWRQELERFDEEDFCNYVSACKGQLSYADLAAAKLPSVALEVARQAPAPQGLEWYLELFKIYERVRHELNFITFDDMLVMAWEVLLQDEELLNSTRALYECVLVDEFQDVNRVQSELLHLITGPLHNLMAIGDDDQTIYEWRGASPSFILEFQRRYDARKYLISDNFRSAASHIALANEVIRHNVNREPKRLNLTRGFDGATHVHLEGSVETQASTIVNELRALMEKGGSLNEAAVLIRAYAQSPTLETMLERAEIPYRLVGALPFYKRPEIAALISYLRLAHLELHMKSGGTMNVARMKEFNASFGLASNNPSRYISRELAERVRETVSFQNAPLSKALVFHAGAAKPHLSKRLSEFAVTLEWLSDTLSEPPEVVLTELVRRLDYLKYWLASSAFPEIGEGRAQAVRAFLVYAKAFQTIPALLSTLDRLQNRSDVEEGLPAVSIMTIHRAKGLEWNVVFIPDCNEGTYPFGTNPNPQRLEEERRLLYVALTRPKQELHLLAISTDPISPFLKEAMYEETLKTARAMAKAMQSDPQKWTAKEAHSIGRGARRLAFERYFKQWWQAPEERVHGVAHAVQRVIRTANKRQLNALLELDANAEAFWASFNPLEANAPDYPDLEALIPAPPQSVPNAAAVDANTTRPGFRVRHKSLGTGVIVAVTGSGTALEVVVNFDGGAQKRLLHRFAALEPA
jgi:DNA helicase II / ATP-dependent DNA helicase PcrA